MPSRPPDIDTVHALINERLERQGIDLSQVNQDPILCKWIYPAADATPLELYALVNYMEKPLETRARDFAYALRLRVSDRFSPAPEPGCDLFYVRIFEMCAGDLLEIIEQIKSKRSDKQFFKGSSHVNAQDPELAVWTAGIEHLSKGTIVSLHYYGTSSKRSGYGRHMEDLRSAKLKPTFLKRFLQEYEVAPESEDYKPYRRFYIYDFPDSHQQPAIGRITSFREQVLIAFGDLQTLLNRDRGGKKLFWRPTSIVQERVKQLGQVNAFAVKELFESPSQATVSAVDEWIEAQQRIISRSKGQSSKLSQEKVLALRRQATVASVKGSPNTTLLVFLGFEPSLGNEMSDCTVWREGAPSIDFIRFTLARIHLAATDRADWESDDASQVEALINLSLLPFIDLKSFYDKAPELLWPELYEACRKYFQAICPLIVCGLGTHISAVIYSYFTKRYLGKTRDEYESAHNQMSLCNHFGPTGDDSGCFVHVPMYHPGAARYDRADTILLGCTLSLIRLSLLVEEFHLRIPHLVNGSRTRQDTCRDAMESAETRFISAGLHSSHEEVVEMMTPKDPKEKPIQQYFENWNGRTIPDSDLRINCVNLGWNNKDGERRLVILELPMASIMFRRQYVGPRTIHFAFNGIDLRVDGVSIPNVPHSYGNPTFPGTLLRFLYDNAPHKYADIISLWEFETGGAVFDTMYPVGTGRATPVPGTDSADTTSFEERWNARKNAKKTTKQSSELPESCGRCHTLGQKCTRNNEFAYELGMCDQCLAAEADEGEIHCMPRVGNVAGLTTQRPIFEFGHESTASLQQKTFGFGKVKQQQKLNFGSPIPGKSTALPAKTGSAVRKSLHSNIRLGEVLPDNLFASPFGVTMPPPPHAHPRPPPTFGLPQDNELGTAMSDHQPAMPPPPHAHPSVPSAFELEQYNVPGIGMLDHLPTTGEVMTWMGSSPSAQLRGRFLTFCLDNGINEPYVQTVEDTLQRDLQARSRFDVPGLGVLDHVPTTEEVLRWVISRPMAEDKARFVRFCDENGIVEKYVGSVKRSLQGTLSSLPQGVDDPF